MAQIYVVRNAEAQPQQTHTLTITCGEGDGSALVTSHGLGAGRQGFGDVEIVHKKKVVIVFQPSDGWKITDIVLPDGSHADPTDPEVIIPSMSEDMGVAVRFGRAQQQAANPQPAAQQHAPAQHHAPQGRLERVSAVLKSLPVFFWVVVLFGLGGIYNSTIGKEITMHEKCVSAVKDGVSAPECHNYASKPTETPQQISKSEASGVMSTCPATLVNGFTVYQAQPGCSVSVRGSQQARVKGNFEVKSVVNNPYGAIVALNCNTFVYNGEQTQFAAIGTKTGDRCFVLALPSDAPGTATATIQSAT